MTILPVVEREMRVAARERNTYRVRFLAAFLTIIFSAFSLWFVTLFKSRPIPPPDLFVALTWIEFIFVTFAGFSLTADSISEERRDGTLGLLFLTDLKGYDILLGKLASATIRGLFALIGTVPVMALPLMLGGTGLAEFMRTSCTIVLTLFFSMAAGLMFSTFVKKSWTAYGCSLFFVVAFVAGPPALSEFVRELTHRTVDISAINRLSPGYALAMSFTSGWGARFNFFLQSIGLMFAITLIMLAISTFVLPFIWKERPPKVRTLALRRLLSAFRFGSDEFRRNLRGRLLALNPVLWLSRREVAPGLTLMLFIAALGGLNFYLANHEWRKGARGEEIVLPMIFWGFTAGVLHLLILLRMPVIAAERFSEDRKTGALELLVSTPMSVHRILRGHWLGLTRYFAGPALSVLFLHLWPILYMVALQPMFSGRSASFSRIVREIAEHLGGISTPGNWENHAALMIMVGLVPIIVLSWISLSWVSTYLSMHVKRPLAIPFVANALCHVFPWLAVAGVFTLMEYQKIRFASDFNEFLFYYSAAFLFEAGTQFFWIWSGRRQLMKNFRTAATDRYQPPKPQRWWQLRIA